MNWINWKDETILVVAGIEECNLQTMVDQINAEQESFGERQLYVQAINRSLEGSDPASTLQVSTELKN